jgi:predicted NUDIX family NTP pyrophosphohydrolase
MDDARHISSIDEAGQQYGVLPWRKDRQGRLRALLVTSRGRGRWIVPKGWPIEDRAPYLSAALEAFEEAGVIGDIRTHPLVSYHYVKQGADGSRQRRRVTLFGLRVRGTLTNWPERGQRRRQWFDLDEAADIVADPELAHAIRRIRAAPQLLTDLQRPSVEDRGHGIRTTGPGASIHP